VIQLKLQNICLTVSSNLKGVGLVKNWIDHDRLFKELLETFFGEFIELFSPRPMRP